MEEHPALSNPCNSEPASSGPGLWLKSCSELLPQDRATIEKCTLHGSNSCIEPRAATLPHEPRQGFEFRILRKHS